MKVLTATNETQGWRANDFSWTVEGELVFFPPIECNCDCCGCRWSFAGTASHRATTTVKVVEREDLDPVQYRELLIDGLMSQGYLTPELLRKRDIQDWVRDEALELRTMALVFPVGAVLERRGDSVFIRDERWEAAS